MMIDWLDVESQLGKKEMGVISGQTICYRQPLDVPLVLQCNTKEVLHCLKSKARREGAKSLLSALNSDEWSRQHQRR